MNAHPIWVVNDFSLRAVAHKLSERRVLTLPLRIVVLNAELSAERRDGNGNNSAHVLIVLLVGALPTWPHSRGWGYYPSGLLGLVLLILLVFLLMGRI